MADAAHSIGAAYRERSIPRLCDVAVFSFYSTKNLTCGEGGLVATRHKVLADRVRTLSRHGISAGTFERKRRQAWEYDVTGVGYKAGLSDINAAIGLGQLTTFESDQARRRRLARRYLDNLADLVDLIELPVEYKHFRHGWHLFIIKLHLASLKIDRARFIKQLARNGIECGVHYQPLFEFSIYRQNLGLSPQHFPNAAYAGRRVVTLPLYPTMKLSDVDYVCDHLRRVLKKNAR